MLYFLFVKWMGLCCFALTLLSMPALVSNIMSKGISKEEQISILDQTTLGNQDEDDPEASYDPSTFNRLHRVMVIYSDLAYTVFLIFFMAVFKCYSRHQAIQIEDVTLTTTDYSV